MVRERLETDGEGAMSTMNDVLMRIQEITNRIRQIQAMIEPQPGDQVNPARNSGQVTASNSSAASAGAKASKVNPAEFQKLLDSALALQGTGSSQSGLGSSGLDLGGIGGGATDLSSLGLPANLQSLLGASGANTGDANAARLQQYQQQLIQAIRDLAATKAQNDASRPPQ